jgi:hypothetical protein
MLRVVMQKVVVLNVVAPTERRVFVIGKDVEFTLFIN